MNRYLTTEEKVKELACWERLCADLPPDVPDEGDERGFPDPPMISWCAMLNALDGICTMQSCAGHKRADGSLTSGVLWLKLSRNLSARFDCVAFSLAKQPGIEWVSRLYRGYGEEIASIGFQGNDHSTLDKSMSKILKFLSDLTV